MANDNLEDVDHYEIAGIVKPYAGTMYEERAREIATAYFTDEITHQQFEHDLATLAEESNK